MLPLIRSGDIVQVCPAEQYRAGDILLYERGSRWFVHRLVRVQAAAVPRLLIFRGDALREHDAAVSPDSVLGKVTQVERGSRTIRLDGWIGLAVRVAAAVPFLRYPILPWLYRAIARVKTSYKQANS